jgi:hypothetical protein
MSFNPEIKNPYTRIVKTMLPLFLLFFITSRINAQNEGISGIDFDDNPNFHLGVKAGIGLSNIESSELLGRRIRPGMSVGLYGNYLFKKHFLVQIGFDGNIKGANFSFTQASSLQRLSLFYMDVPLTVHYNYSKNSKLLPFIGVQPSLIFRKDAYKTQEAVPQPIVLDIKNYDFALTAGLLFRLDPRVALQLQFNYGVVNINNKLSVPFYPYLGNGSPMYNRNLQLCLVF